MSDFPLLLLTIAAVWTAAGMLWAVIELAGKRLR